MTKDRHSSGHHFWPNGDMSISYRVGRLFVTFRWGFRDGEKVLVDSECEPACQECGMPEERYHSTRCKRWNKRL